MNILVGLGICLLIGLPAYGRAEQASPATSDHNGRNEERPRRLSADVGGSDRAVAEYANACLDKIRRIGSLNFPSEAGHPIYGEVLVSFEVLPSGVLLSVRIERSSGLQSLDAAALRLVKLASPFPEFSRALRNLGDVIVIRRPITYKRGSGSVESQLAPGPSPAVPPQ